MVQDGLKLTIVQLQPYPLSQVTEFAGMHHHAQVASAIACREEFKVVPSLVLRQGFTEAEGTGVNGQGVLT